MKNRTWLLVLILIVVLIFLMNDLVEKNHQREVSALFQRIELLEDVLRNQTEIDSIQIKVDDMKHEIAINNSNLWTAWIENNFKICEVEWGE